MGKKKLQTHSISFRSPGLQIYPQVLQLTVPRGGIQYHAQVSETGLHFFCCLKFDWIFFWFGFSACTKRLGNTTRRSTAPIWRTTMQCCSFTLREPKTRKKLSCTRKNWWPVLDGEPLEEWWGVFFTWRRCLRRPKRQLPNPTCCWTS